MLRPLVLLPALAGILLLASCHSVPKHARFIPADALMVIGVHPGEMKRELAWSAITGSPLMKELRSSEGSGNVPAMLRDVEHSGIDFSSTLYFYTRPDARFSTGARMAAVLPVSDAGKVEAYLKKHMPGLEIRAVKDRKEASIDGKYAIGWNDEVLIAMNSVVRREEAPEDTVSPDSLARPVPEALIREFGDPQATAAALDSAFKPARDASIAGDDRFKELEDGGHDITMWVGYDALSDTYGARGGMDMMGMMSGALWKGSAMATGIDFAKGRVDAEMRYYASDSMRPVFRELGKENVDAEMLRRLPATGLNFAAGYHLAPAALRTMLDKMGLSGLANLALISNGSSVDEILGAFSGDMVVSVNNFRVETKMQEIDSATQRDFGLRPQPVSSPKMDFVFAMKVGDKAKMARLMRLVSSTASLQQIAPNIYTLPNIPDAPTFVLGERYVAVSSTAGGAQAFLRDDAGNMPEAVKAEIAGHPSGLWMDLRSMLFAAQPMSGGSPADSAALAAIAKTFTTLKGHGGEFKGKATQYHMSIGFANEAESSLLQLLRLAQELAAARNGAQVAMR